MQPDKVRQLRVLWHLISELPERLHGRLVFIQEVLGENKVQFAYLQ